MFVCDLCVQISVGGECFLFCVFVFRFVKICVLWERENAFVFRSSCILVQMIIIWHAYTIFGTGITHFTAVLVQLFYGWRNWLVVRAQSCSRFFKLIIRIDCLPNFIVPKNCSHWSSIKDFTAVKLCQWMDAYAAEVSRSYLVRPTKNAALTLQHSAGFLW